MSGNIFEIKVVDRDGERLFCFSQGDSTILFNSLSAYVEFEGGSLALNRNGEAFYQTQDIREFGTHANSTCFVDHHGQGKRVLLAQECENDDVLLLETSNEAPYGGLSAYDSFTHFLLRKFNTDQALSVYFDPKNKDRPLQEVSNLFKSKFDALMTSTPPDILRFEA